MKHKYTKKQIQEAIKYWENQLALMNEAQDYNSIKKSKPMVDSIYFKKLTGYDAVDVPLTFLKPKKAALFLYGSTRPMCIIKVNGINVPFYCSSGEGGKDNVPTNKWYPIMGFNGNWLNKTREKDINAYYYSTKLKEIAQKLDAVFPHPYIQGDTIIRPDFPYCLEICSAKAIASYGKNSPYVLKDVPSKNSTSTQIKMYRSQIIWFFDKVNSTKESIQNIADRWKNANINFKNCFVDDFNINELTPSTQQILAAANLIKSKNATENIPEVPLSFFKNKLKYGKHIQQFKQMFGDNIRFWDENQFQVQVSGQVTCIPNEDAKNGLAVNGKIIDHSFIIKPGMIFSLSSRTNKNKQICKFKIV